jgi:hypothetical protein
MASPPTFGPRARMSEPLRPSWYKPPEENNLDYPASYGLSQDEHDLFVGICRTTCIEPAFAIVLLTQYLADRLCDDPVPDLTGLFETIITECRTPSPEVGT